jgi:type I restriction enzyme, S subunit
MVFTELPKHWEVVRHSDIAEINPKLPFQAVDDETEVSFVPMKLVEEESNVIHLTETRKLRDVKKGFTSFTNGDVIFAKITPCMENGKCAVARDLKNGIGFGSTEFHVSRPQSRVLSQYIFYFLTQKSLRRLAENSMTGSVGQKRVPTQFFRELEIPLPPLAEQQRIVARLEELFSELDAGLASLRTAAQQLKTYRQAVLKWAFEGRLTNESVNEGGLPAGWKWVKLGEVASSVEYGSAAKSKAAGKIPVLRMGNIQNGKFDWDDLVYTDDDAEIEKYLLKKNDVLFNRTNSAELVGKTAIYKGERPAIFAGYLIRINRIASLIEAEYLTYFLNSHTAKSYGNTVKSFGVNQSNINGAKLKTYPIPLCSLEEQRRIVQEIESRLSVCDKLEETIAAALRQAEALRQSVLQQAFTGKLLRQEKELPTPSKLPFYQMRLLGLIVYLSQRHKIRHGEMTIAKYAYLLDRVYDVPTYYNFRRGNLGPYSGEIKKTIHNRTYFKMGSGGVELQKVEQLLKYSHPYRSQIEAAIDELAEIFLSFGTREQPHKTELLATVCKVIEDIQSLDLQAIRQSMADWGIELPTARHKNKAQKFTEEETAKCLTFIVKKGWDKKLLQLDV